MARMSTDITVALFDLQMPQASGLDCLRFVREHFADTQVIVISQFGEVRTAVQAIKQGAFEYITKPIDPDELVTRVRQSIRSNRLARENRQLRQAVRQARCRTLPSSAASPGSEQGPAAGREALGPGCQRYSSLARAARGNRRWPARSTRPDRGTRSRLLPSVVLPCHAT